MPAPILKQGKYLIATVESTLSDHEWLRLQDDLVRKVGEARAQGVVIDVTLLDVMDSFATRTLRTLAQVCRLRGASVVIVGIQPEVAFTMVQLGIAGQLRGIDTALDLEEGLARLGGHFGGRET